MKIHSKFPLAPAVANGYLGIHLKITNSQFVPKPDVMVLRDRKNDQNLVAGPRAAALKLAVEFDYAQFHSDA